MRKNTRGSEEKRQENSFQDEHAELSNDRSRRRDVSTTEAKQDSEYDDESSQSEEREFNL
eukprot:CAMPEP_0185583418 /NCGR_PEP_ID=MMETSP0434-20130131/21514_1 /TAXON_ID=626734 ORGANISM="Favella taraikaensis, Strain Fe Narragansett Bay" /NCGR_SAMPLE_ID=MMETSP0434 /ASSEMBLY_ACC=CAM_ASM_000379 /LENGTH=59 /DNA_ID=CAMNT_0028202491 /DNA_START=471 /DNA_END=650 /DNA_ORIENTATION=-